MDPEDQKVVDNMALYGGGFVQQLAELTRHADPINLVKIKTTWPEYWKTYKNWGKGERKPRGTNHA